MFRSEIIPVFTYELYHSLKKVLMSKMFLTPFEHPAGLYSWQELVNLHNLLHTQVWNPQSTKPACL